MVIEKKEAALMLPATTILIGFGGMLGQLMLLRELLVVFYGNELTLGVILGNWLLFEALGAFSGDSIKYTASRLFYGAGLILYAFMLPAALYLTRGINYSLFNLLPGETAGFSLILVTSLVILAPVSFVHGALFPLGSRMMTKAGGSGINAPGRIYLFETAGSLLGGLLFSLILASLFLAHEIALVLLIVHLLTAFVLLYRYFVNPALRALTALLPLTALLVLFFFPSLSGLLHQHSLNRQWPDHELIHYENSPYGNIVITHNHREYTFFYDGRPAMTVPNPDRATLEDLVHLAAGAHPAPRKVLLIGGGAGGILETLLKHPVENIYFVELDPRLPALYADLPLEKARSEIGNPRVTVITADARQFLIDDDNSYDLILIGLFQPDTLQENRLFTRQFFELVRHRLNDHGLLVFSVKGAPLRLTPDVLPLNASLLRTLAAVFPHYSVLPGELNLFFAGNYHQELNAALLYERLSARGLTAGFINEKYLLQRFDSMRIGTMIDDIYNEPARINEDYQPAGFYYALLSWGGLYSYRLYKVLNKLENAPVLPYTMIITFLLFLSARLISRKEKYRSISIYYAIFSSGLSGMAFSLLLIFVFQTLYGQVYQMIGLLIAAFMSGNILGGTWGIGAGLQKEKKNLFRLVDLIILLMHPTIYGAALLLQALTFQLSPLLLTAAISILALISGAAVGAQFPLATGLIYIHSRGKERSGSIYAADLLGGWLGSLIVALVFFPLLGLGTTLLLLCFFKAGGFILLCLDHQGHV